MSGIFNLDAPIWVFMGEVADLIILSLLWWVCCLGIVTIGASTTAMYYVLGKKMRKETTYVARDFFKSFSQNFRQSVPLSFLSIIGVVSFFLYVTFIIQSLTVAENAPNIKFFLPLTLIVAFELFNFNAYLWSLLSRFEMTSGALLKTTFVMIHKHLITTFGNLIVVVVVCLLIYKCAAILIMAPGLIMAGQSFLLQKVYTRYIEAAKESEKDKEEQLEDSLNGERAE